MKAAVQFLRPDGSAYTVEFPTEDDAVAVLALIERGRRGWRRDLLSPPPRPEKVAAR